MRLSFTPEELPLSTFACGPGQAHPVVRETPLYKTLFERSHRAADISTKGLYKEAEDNLRTLLHLPDDYTVVFFMGGATPAMDAVVWSLTKQSLSGLSFGAFSERWCHQLAGRLEKSVTRDFKKPENGSYFPLEKPDLNASLVLLTPNETSLGVQIPNAYLSHSWKNKGADTLIAWDCTSCAGGRVLPENQFDVMVFGLQKCFGAGGGTAVLILSPAAVNRISEVKKYRSVPYSLDLTEAVKQAQKKAQTVNTPNTTNIWIFNKACQWMNDNGGLPAMEALCRQHADYLLEWAAQTGWLRPLVTDPDYRSFTTLTLAITDPAIEEESINAALRATGLPNLQDGVARHPYAPQNSLRISCFPFADITGISQYKKLTQVIDKIAGSLRQARP